MLMIMMAARMKLMRRVIRWAEEGEYVMEEGAG